MTAKYQHIYCDILYIPDPLIAEVLTDSDRATLPGVMLGSSSTLLLFTPCHG